MLDLKHLGKSILSNISDIYQHSLGNSIDKTDIILGENTVMELRNITKKSPELNDFFP